MRQIWGAVEYARRQNGIQLLPLLPKLGGRVHALAPRRSSGSIHAQKAGFNSVNVPLVALLTDGILR